MVRGGLIQVLLVQLMIILFFSLWLHIQEDFWLVLGLKLQPWGCYSKSISTQSLNKQGHTHPHLRTYTHTHAHAHTKSHTQMQTHACITHILSINIYRCQSSLPTSTYISPIIIDGIVTYLFHSINILVISCTWALQS